MELRTPVHIRLVVLPHSKKREGGLIPSLSLKVCRFWLFVSDDATDIVCHILYLPRCDIFVEL